MKLSQAISRSALFTYAFLSTGTAVAEDGASLSLSVKTGEKPSAKAEASNSSEGKSEKAEDKVLGPDLPYMKRYVPENNMWELGLFGGVMFPSGQHELYAPGSPETQQGFEAAGEVGLRLAYFPLAFLGVEGEGAGIPTKAKDDTSAGMWAARAHLVAQLPGSSVTPFLLVGGGALGAASDSMGSDVDPSLNLGIGVKAALDEHLGFRLDLRDSMSQKFDAAQGALTHHPEVLFGITFTPERRRPDYDRDGVNDFRDGCPRRSGEFSGCPAPDQDGDGIPDEQDACPEVASTHPSGCADQDADGVEDSKDACPEVAGVEPTGCPSKECSVKDSDGDGRTDEADECPNEAAKTDNGCPVVDQDGDGVLDADDQCVSEPETKNGFKDADGCPDEVPEAVKKFDGVMDGIVFEHGSSDVAAASAKKLEETVAVMKEYPSLHVEIAGHTDSTGDEEHNKKLSLARADSVKAFLTERGIESGRIETAGYGSDKPLADNATPAGRQQNRRIEFHLVAE